VGIRWLLSSLTSERVTWCNPRETGFAWIPQRGENIRGTVCVEEGGRVGDEKEYALGVESKGSRSLQRQQVLSQRDFKVPVQGIVWLLRSGATSKAPVSGPLQEVECVARLIYRTRVQYRYRYVKESLSKIVPVTSNLGIFREKCSQI